MYRSALLLAAFTIGASGCLPDETTNPTPLQAGDRDDAGAAPDGGVASDGGAVADGGGEADGAAVEADAGFPPAPDMGPVPEGGQPCQWPADCPFGDCVEGACYNERPARCPDDPRQCPEGEVCGGFQERFYCYKPCERDGSCPLRPRPCAAHVDCPSEASCHGDYCIRSCATDVDCGDEGYCFEGECRPFPFADFAGDPPAPLGAAGQLHAGVGVVPLDYPIGVSMAGYGGRPGKRTPYNVALGGSDRVFEHQDVRALALSNDEEILIVLRLPTSWSTDYMMSLTAQKLQALTGVNYLGKIVTAATHSHSQPGRYWNLVPATGFGVFGYGSFSPEMVERYTTSFAEAAKAALDDLQPARFGWTIVDDFDPQDRIHSDRRGESPRFKDGRLMVWRVEDMEGDPLAGLVNFAIHGTHMDLTWITGDVAGPIEVVLSERLSARAGRDVPVMFINGNAGDVSPRGDDNVRAAWGKIQVVGHRVWPHFEAAWDAIEPTAELPMEVVMRRVPVSYELLGYDREGRNAFTWRDDSPQLYGGFQCVQVGRDPDEEPYEPTSLGCALNLEAFLGAPVVQFQKTVLSAFRLGDLVVTTLPGEPSSWLGTFISESLETMAIEAGQRGVRVMNFGYAQDHHLYLLLEEDWFHGGYEAAQGVWGWRHGRYIVEQSIELAAQLFTDEKEDNETGVKPTVWHNLVDDTVTPTPTETPPTVLEAPAAVIRGELFEVQWTGGHPGVDLPYVVLERQEGDTWSIHEKSPGVPFDDHGLETLLIYRGDYETDHTWAIRWETPWHVPAGTYRLSIAGHTWAAGETRPYALSTDAFELSPATLVVRDQAVAGTTIAVELNYPDGPTNDDGATPFEALEPRGHWLRVDPEARYDGALREYSFVLGPSLPLDQPLRFQLLNMDTDEEGEAMPAADDVTVTLVTARAEGGEEEVATLPGWPSTRVEIEAPGPGEYLLRVRDAWDNVAELDVVVP